MDISRQKEFKKNEGLEKLLKEINKLLGPAEDNILTGYDMPKYPLVLIVGGPRSGSTLTLQWLAETGRFAYPTNLLSRFYGAPYIGAKIQLLLTSQEYNFKNEILDFNSNISFESQLGKTRGALQPNDFWYFWRRFIPNTDPVYLDEQSLKRIDSKKFVAEIAAIEAVFDKPFAMKGMILEQNIPFLSSIFKKVIFLYIKRHPFFNVQSLLESRVSFFGDRTKWYSIKPKEYDELKDLHPIEQVAGQVYFKNHSVEEGIRQIDTSRWLQVEYEDLCENPEKIFYQLTEKFTRQGCKVDWHYTGPEQFQSADQVRLKEDECEKVIKAYRKFSGIDITP